jgi:phage tail sheath protein FI
MPFNKLSPGVYVEEVASGARPIESAATSNLAMIGLCREAIDVEVEREIIDPIKGRVKALVKDKKKTPNTPTLVTNWTQFIQTYGDRDEAVPGGFLHEAMYGYFLNGGTTAYVVGIPVPVEDHSDPAPLELPRAQDFLLNAAGQQTLKLTTTRPLNAGEKINVTVAPPDAGAPPDTFNLVIKRDGGDPKPISNLTTNRGKGLRNVVEVLTKETDGLLSADIVGSGLPVVGAAANLVYTPPAPPTAPVATTNGATGLKQKLNLDLFRGNLADRTGIAGLEAVEEVTLVACPDIVAVDAEGKPAASEEDIKSVQRAILDHCEIMKDRFAILDTPFGLSVQDAIAWRNNKIGFDSKYAALYYPWIKANGKFLPPSGHTAGLYARVDAERGVFKAPANEVLRGVVGLERNITRNEQDNLNPIGVNCIRAFPGQGIRVWGARTLSTTDAQWRYIPVRRLFCNVEESILQSTSWVVFEPNDETLWRQIRRDISAYLTVQWRGGALFGATPEQAFFVKCDAETNPPELRDLGYCVVEVGMAPVKPAEFVVFRVSQIRDGSGGSSE